MISKEQLIKPFADFEPALQEELLKKGSLHTHEPGEKIIKSGEEYLGTVLILDGLVKMFRRNADGEMIFMFYLQPGEAAYLAVLEGEEDNINMSEMVAVADKRTTVLTVSYNSSTDWVTRFRTWYFFVVRSYRRRFEELFLSLDNMAFRGLDDRLMSYLRRQRHIFGTDELNVSHQQIAQDLNTSREVVSRLLKKMERKGMITLSRNKITIEKLNDN